MKSSEAAYKTGDSLDCITFFSLNDQQQNTCNNNHPSILYFFNADSDRGGKKGLVQLYHNQTVQKFKNLKIKFFPITLSSKKSIMNFLDSNNMISFPIFHSTHQIFDKLSILPTIFVLNTNNKIDKIIEGFSSSTLPLPPSSITKQTYKKAPQLLYGKRKSPKPKPKTKTKTLTNAKDLVLFHQSVSKLALAVNNFQQASDFLSKAILTAKTELPMKKKLQSDLYIENANVYEKRNDFKQAHLMYKEAIKNDPENELALVLEKVSLEKMKLRSSFERKKRVDHLLNQLESRYRQRNRFIARFGRMFSNVDDDWSSKHIVLSFIISKQEIFPIRDVFIRYFCAKLSDHLSHYRRITFVDREIFDSYLEELKIGTSNVVDPNYRLNSRLWPSNLKIKIEFFLNRIRVNLVETETTKILPIDLHVDVINEKIDEFKLSRISDKIIDLIKKTYPLKGYMAWKKNENKVLINIGKNHGIQVNDIFDIVIQEKIDIVGNSSCLFPFFRPKVFHSPVETKTIGQIKVTRSEKEYSIVDVINPSQLTRKIYKIKTPQHRVRHSDQNRLQYSKKKANKTSIVIWDQTDKQFQYDFFHHISNYLIKKKNFNVLERNAFLELLEENNIPENISNKKVLINMGKMNGANFMIFVDTYYMPEKFLHLRLVDVETSKIKKIAERSINGIQPNKCRQIILSATKELFEQE